MFYAIDKKNYDICKLLIEHGADVNIKGKDGKSILETANATGDETIISLIKEHKNIKTANKEIKEARKQLKNLEIKQIIDIKTKNIAELEMEKARLNQLKQLLTEQQEERDNLETQVEFLIQDTDSRAKRFSKLKTKNSQTKLLLQHQNAESQATISNMLDKISDINESINKHTTEIKALQIRTVNYEQQKQEYEFYKKCFQEGKYDRIIKELNRECPICFEEMRTPIKIFQCSEGHLLCENCFNKVSVSTKKCPVCRMDIVTTPIRNRALEEAIENEARRDMGAASWN